MNHLYRDLAPISEAAWEQIDDEAKSRLVTYLAARKLVDLAGPHGWEPLGHRPGPGRARWPARPKASPRRSAASSRWSSCGPTSPCRARSSTTPTGAPDDIDLPELDEAVRQIALAENSTVFHGYAGRRDAGHHRVQLAHALAFEEDMEQYPNVVAQAVTCCGAPASAARTGWPSSPRSTPASSRRPSTAATCSSTTCARSSAARWCGRRASRAASCSACAAATSSSRAARTSPSATAATTPTSVRLYIEESFSFRVLEPDAAIALRRG